MSYFRVCSKSKTERLKGTVKLNALFNPAAGVPEAGHCSGAVSLGRKPVAFKLSFQGRTGDAQKLTNLAFVGAGQGEGAPDEEGLHLLQGGEMGDIIEVEVGGEA